MATRSGTGGGQALDVLRARYPQLYNVLAESPPTRESLANKFYQTHFIDLLVKVEITSNSSGLVGARTLLDHLVLKVEQCSDYLPSVISIMGSEASLSDITRQMDAQYRRRFGLRARDEPVSCDCTTSMETGEPLSQLSYNIYVIIAGPACNRNNQYEL